MLNREEQLRSVYQETFDLLRPQLFQLRLSEAELESFGEYVYSWFERFSRRPGNEWLSVSRLRVSLVSGACTLARNLAESKGVSTSSFAGDPMHLAAQLGIISNEKGSDA
ncbi:MAG: hypothetical protein ABI592_01860 [Acidobacteriota bacterium]